jgi:hypothetical protein
MSAQIQRPAYILSGEDFAALFGRTKTWLYNLSDPPPKCQVKELCYNTHDPKVREWVEKRLGPIDWSKFDE